MPRSSKLLALVTLVVAASLVSATGAFSSVTAQRSADVQVTDDASAYLALEPHQNSPNGEGGYARQTSAGQLALNLDGDYSADNGATGVNPDAVTDVERVFNVTNQGTQSVGVWVADDSDAVTFYQGTNGDSVETSGNAVTVAPGETITVSLTVDTTGMSADAGTVLSDVTVHANATQA